MSSPRDRAECYRPEHCECCSCFQLCLSHLECMDEPCQYTECDSGASWLLRDVTVYGDDADGNRGVPLYLWECKNCGREMEVIG